jgi:hypothetical protein
VSDQLSQPYKTTGKIMVLYILIFTLLDSKLFCSENNLRDTDTASEEKPKLALSLLRLVEITDPENTGKSK